MLETEFQKLLRELGTELIENYKGLLARMVWFDLSWLDKVNIYSYLRCFESNWLFEWGS